MLTFFLFLGERRRETAKQQGDERKYAQRQYRKRVRLCVKFIVCRTDPGSSPPRLFIPETTRNASARLGKTEDTVESWGLVEYSDGTRITIRWWFRSKENARYLQYKRARVRKFYKPCSLFIAWPDGLIDGCNTVSVTMKVTATAASAAATVARTQSDALSSKSERHRKLTA